MISFSEAQLLAWVTPLLWPFVRALALFTAMPVFGTRTVPMRVRIGLAAFVSLAAQPMLPPIATVALDAPPALLIAAQQVVIGLVMGFAVRLVFAAVEFGGELIGLQMGLNFAAFFDPMSASNATATSRFFGTTIAWLFVVGNGHLVVILALAHSFTAIPVAPEPLAWLYGVQPQQWGAQVFSGGLAIALPLVVMMLLVNLVLGVISRVAPQINVFSIGFPITLAVGLLGMLVTLPLLDVPFNAALARMLSHFQ